MKPVRAPPNSCLKMACKVPFAMKSVSNQIKLDHKVCSLNCKMDLRKTGYSILTANGNPNKWWTCCDLPTNWAMRSTWWWQSSAVPYLWADKTKSAVDSLWYRKKSVQNSNMTQSVRKVCPQYIKICWSHFIKYKWWCGYILTEL